jgi:molecular chaperone GrpE
MTVERSSEETIAEQAPEAEEPQALPEQRPEQADREEHEQKLQDDLEELSAKAEKADEYLELAQRTKADFENYRKRALREAAAAQERGMAKLAKELLPAIDNLDRALEAAEAAALAEAQAEKTEQSEDGAAPLISGIKLVHADVIAALARVGIEPFSPEGQQFDPQRHEAVAQQPVDGAEPGTVVEVYQRGYQLGEGVLRPARVLVAA